MPEAPPVFEQSPLVRECLRVNLGRHWAGQHRIMLLAGDGGLLLLWRGRDYDNTETRVTRKVHVPASNNWAPALTDAGYLSRQKAA